MNRNSIFRSIEPARFSETRRLPHPYSRCQGTLGFVNFARPRRLKGILIVDLCANALSCGSITFLIYIHLYLKQTLSFLQHALVLYVAVRHLLSIRH